jgi:hypothetical protein
MISQVDTGEGTAVVGFIRGLIVGDKEIANWQGRISAKVIEIPKLCRTHDSPTVEAIDHAKGLG